MKMTISMLRASRGLTFYSLFTLTIFLIPMKRVWGQNASTYSFLQSIDTYIPLNSSTVLGSGSSLDDVTYSITSSSLSGFVFNFAGTNYTAFTVSSNGFIGLGSSLMGTTMYTPLSSTSGGNVFVSAYADDLGGLDANTKISWNLEGASPNRELVVEYKNVRNLNRSGCDVSFQIRLSETTNIIKVIYGTMIYTSTTSDAVQVGIKSSTTSGHFSNRTTTTNWNSTSGGSTNTSSCTVLNTVTMPNSGLTFTWTPPTCFPPTALTTSAISYQTATIGWTAPTSGTSPGNYEYEIRTSGSAGSGASGLVTSGTVATNSTSVTGLTGGTLYTYYVRSSCGSGDFSTWTSGTFTTTSCASLPTSVSSNTITVNSANISWTAATGSPAGYEYEIRTSGAAGSGSTGLVTTSTTTSPTVSASITGLSSNTTYSTYVRTVCYSGYISAWTSASTFTTLKIEPTNQITNLSASSVSSSSIPLSWIAATGAQLPDGYLVKASSVSLAAISDPVDGTDPANVTAFTANAANKKQTSGTATSTTSFTGMSAGTMYYYKVYSYTNSSTAIDFKTDNPATLNHATLPNNSSALSFAASPLNSSGATITWTAATGYDASKHTTLVFIKSGSAISLGTPNTDPSLYSANTSFTGSSTVYQGDNSAKCVYNGDGTSVIISSLTGSTTYYILILNVMQSPNSNGSYTYSSGATTSGITFKIEPTNQLSSLAVGTVSSTVIPLTWIAATGAQIPDGYLVKASSVSLAAITDPVDGTDPADVTAFTANAANKKQTSGTATSTTSFTGMSAGTMYYYKVYSYTNSSTAIDFKTDNVPTLSHATTPLTTTSMLFSAVTNSTMQISWTNPAGYNNASHQILVFVKSGSAITSGSPTINSSGYTPNTIFGSGTQFQNDINAYCVFNGDGSSVQISNLTANTSFHILVYCLMQDANSNGNTSYSAALTGNKTTQCDPVALFNLTFEGSSSLPQCTSFSSSDGLGANINNINPYQGLNCLGLQTQSTIYILPRVNNSELNTHEINFYARTFSGTGQIGFGYLTNPSDANSYVNLQTFNLTTTYQLCNFVPQNIPANIYPALKLISSSVLRVDNISWGLQPSIVWSNQAWSNTTGPTSIDNATISDNLSLTSNLSCNNLLINSGYTLTVPSNYQLTISGTLTNNGTLTLESGATLVQGASSTLAGTGTYNVKQDITGANNGSTPNGRFWYLGSPVSLASSSAYFTSNAANVVKKRDEVNNAWTALSSGTPENLVVGQGYYTQAMGNATINFTGGLLNNGPITIGNLSRTAGQGFEGFNLVSNPYPSYLDWDAVTKTDVGNTMWYRTASGSTAGSMVFDTYVAGTGGIGTNLNGAVVSNLIPPMQSFWVRVNSGSTTGSLGLTNSMRAHFTSINGSVAGLKSTSNERDLFLRMNLLQAGKKDQIIVYVNDIATNGFDQFDGEKMMQAGLPQFYTSAAGKKITINGLNSAKKQQALPITMELPNTGVHSFVIEDLEISNGLVWLEDKQEEIMQALEPGTVYEFYANSGINAERFVLHFQLIDDATPINVYNEVNNSANFSGKGASVHAESAGVVVIKLPATTEGITDIQIRDAAGRLVYTGSTNTLETSVQLAQANGIYYVTLNSTSGVEVRKVFIQQ